MTTNSTNCCEGRDVSWTPGPWFHAPHDDKDIRLFDRIVTATGEIIVEDVAQESDARLIAAAPEMAEALRKARNLLALPEPSVGGHGGDWCATTSEEDALVAEIDALLAKVTGA